MQSRLIKIRKVRYITTHVNNTNAKWIVHVHSLIGLRIHPILMIVACETKNRENRFGTYIRNTRRYHNINISFVFFFFFSTVRYWLLYSFANTMMIANIFLQSDHVLFIRSPLTRIYARLAIKGEERNARLAKLHKMPSSVVSILFLGASKPYRSLRHGQPTFT